jgi:outer membrane lipoprotein-sorting protein
MAIEDDPTARALYEDMKRAFATAETLRYTSSYRWWNDDNELGSVTYEMNLAKPDLARMEAASALPGGRQAVVVGDGNAFWTYWPTGAPKFSSETDDESSGDVYMCARIPAARFSLAHKAAQLGVGMAMTILQPSLFFGVQDSTDGFLDAVSLRGRETVGGEVCDVLELSIMDGQRTRVLWLSVNDHLPRRLSQTILVSNKITMEEIWSSVTVNAEMPSEQFVWQPPENWSFASRSSAAARSGCPIFAERWCG